MESSDVGPLGRKAMRTPKSHLAAFSSLVPDSRRRQGEDDGFDVVLLIMARPHVFELQGDGGADEAHGAAAPPGEARVARLEAGGVEHAGKRGTEGAA